MEFEEQNMGFDQGNFEELGLQDLDMGEDKCRNSRERVVMSEEDLGESSQGYTSTVDSDLLNEL
jgi:hypothetical protein